jgi:hypothetical protein
MATDSNLRNLHSNGNFMKNYDSEVLYEMYKKKCEKLDEAIAIIKELEHRAAKQMVMVQHEHDACQRWMNIAQDNDQLYLDTKHKLHCAQESIRYKTKVIKDIEERLREAALETDPVKMRVTICRALGVSTMDAR